MQPFGGALFLIAAFQAAPAIRASMERLIASPTTFVQDGRQVDEAARNGHAGQVRDPDLVRAIGNAAFGQVGVDRPGMVAVGRHNVAPPLFWLQIVFPHQAPEPFAVHHDALMAQRCPDPAITIHRRSRRSEREVHRRAVWLGARRRSEPPQLTPLLTEMPRGR